MEMIMCKLYFVRTYRRSEDLERGLELFSPQKEQQKAGTVWCGREPLLSGERSVSQSFPQPEIM